LAFEQAAQLLAQADSQQTPSTQLPLAQSPAAAQTAPWPFTGTQAVPAQ
jgi:hypothetical protein